MACLIAAGLSPKADAQFGNLLKAPGSAPAGTVVSKADFSKLLDSTTGNVLAARIEFFRAQADLASALGLKNDSLIKASEGLRAVEGPSSSPGDRVKALQDSTTTTEESRKELSDALAKSDTLSDESKAKFLQGTVKFIQAVVLEKAQSEAIEKLVAEGKALASSASMFEKIKVLSLIKPATTMATIVPGDVKEGATTFGQITSFAQKQNIQMPSESEQMNKLGGGDAP